MVLVTNINRSPYKHPSTCDWSKNLEKNLKVSMWNGISIVKNDSHDKLNL